LANNRIVQDKNTSGARKTIKRKERADLNKLF